MLFQRKSLDNRNKLRYKLNFLIYSESVLFQQLPSLKALHAFEAASRLCSFNAAALELCVSQGAISYQIKRLETSLGVQLFHRRVRQVELTQKGERLYRLVHRHFVELSGEISEIAPTNNATTLTMSVSTYFVTRWLSSRLGRFLNSHSNLAVNLQHSVNDPDFVFEHCDLAIRWGDGNWPNTQSEALMHMPMMALCAPSLMPSESNTCLVADLLNYPFLCDQPGMNLWSEWLREAKIQCGEPVFSSVIKDPNVRVQSAIDAQGMVLGNPLLKPEIDSGQLCEPSQIRLEGYGYYMVFGPKIRPNQSLEKMVDWLRAEGKAWQTAYANSVF